MDNMIKKLVSGFAAFALIFAVAACEKEGPAEQAGKSVDNAVEKAGDKIENAGDKVEDATDRNKN